MKADARARPRSLPRRRKPSLLARVRPFWIVAIILVAALTWGAVWLAGSPWFRVARIGVDVPLGSPVSRERVRAVAAIPAGANVWLIDSGAVARRIEAIPYVDRASVHRGQLPQPFVELTITTRHPSACVRAGERVVTIDETSRVLQDNCAAAALTRIEAGRGVIPRPGRTVTDRDTARLLADVKTLSDANLAVRSIGRDRWGGLEAVDVTGVRLEFGDDVDLSRKAALVEPVRSGVGTRRAIRAIDVRTPGTPTVEFR